MTQRENMAMLSGGYRERYCCRQIPPLSLSNPYDLSTQTDHVQESIQSIHVYSGQTSRGVRLKDPSRVPLIPGTCNVNRKKRKTEGEGESERIKVDRCGERAKRMVINYNRDTRDSLTDCTVQYIQYSVHNT